LAVLAINSVSLRAGLHVAVWVAGLALLTIGWFALLAWAGHGYLVYVRRYLEVTDDRVTFSSILSSEFLSRNVQRRLWSVPLRPPKNGGLRALWTSAVIRFGVALVTPVIGVVTLALMAQFVS
jgi:hypothetical protein